jgi:hypothetical protein
MDRTREQHWFASQGPSESTCPSALLSQEDGQRPRDRPDTLPEMSWFRLTSAQGASYDLDVPTVPIAVRSRGAVASCAAGTLVEGIRPRRYSARVWTRVADGCERPTH